MVVEIYFIKNIRILTQSDWPTNPVGFPMSFSSSLSSVIDIDEDFGSLITFFFEVGVNDDLVSRVVGFDFGVLVRDLFIHVMMIYTMTKIISILKNERKHIKLIEFSILNIKKITYNEQNTNRYGHPKQYIETICFSTINLADHSRGGHLVS